MSEAVLDPPTFLGQSLGRQICDYLRDAILHGRLAPDRRLTEIALAKEFRVSRTPIREALRRLEAEGLIEFLPNRQAVVRGFSSDQIAEVYDLRILLEGYAARRAADRLNDDDLARLESQCAEFDAIQGAADASVERTRRLVDLNSQIHHAITRAGGSQRLWNIVRLATEVPLVFRSYLTTNLQARDAGEFHRRIVAALRARDGERAERLMREHLTQAKQSILEHMKGGS